MYISSFSFFTFYLFFIIILIIILILFPFIQFFAWAIMGHHTLHIFKSKYIVFLKIPFNKKKKRKATLGFHGNYFLVLQICEHKLKPYISKGAPM